MAVWDFSMTSTSQLFEHMSDLIRNARAQGMEADVSFMHKQTPATKTEWHHKAHDKSPWLLGNKLSKAFIQMSLPSWTYQERLSNYQTCGDLLEASWAWGHEKRHMWFQHSFRAAECFRELIHRYPNLYDTLQHRENLRLGDLWTEIALVAYQPDEHRDRDTDLDGL